MTTQIKENNFSEKTIKSPSTTSKSKLQRPNIDHLIKRILTERRKEQKKNILIFVFVLLIVFGSVIFSYYS
tara:strand:+ start:271 stop:483 length:213 start_codon:yes stop_codon:yes gene_type:complete